MHSTNYDNNTAASTWWLRNASFLRLKNIEVGYNFKEKTLKKIGIQALRVYLQGNNLCVWDDIKMWTGTWKHQRRLLISTEPDFHIRS